MKTQTTFTLAEIAAEIGQRLSKAEIFKSSNVRRLGEDEFSYVSDEEYNAYADEFFEGDDDEPDEDKAAWRVWAEVVQGLIVRRLEAMPISEEA